MVTRVKDNVLTATIAISLATLVIVVISYMDSFPALPTWPSHLISILSRPNLRAPPHLRVFPPLTVSMMTIFTIRQPSQLLLLLLPKPVMPLLALLIHLLLDPGFYTLVLLIPYLVIKIFSLVLLLPLLYLLLS